MNMSLRNRVGSFGVALAAAIFSTSASAAAPATIADLASSVSFADVALAILAIAGVILTLYTTWKGAKFVIRAVKSA